MLFRSEAPSVGKKSRPPAARIKPVFPSSRRWSSTGRDYRIIPRKLPIQAGLEWVTERSRRKSCMGVALFAPLFSFASRQCCPHADSGHKINHFHLFRTTRYGNWLLGLAAHLIHHHHHHRIIHHSLHPAGRLAARMTWPTSQTQSTRLAFPIIK